MNILKLQMNRKNKILAVILSLLIAVTMVPATAFADSTVVTPDTSWYNAGSSTFTLNNANQLAGLAVLVNGGNDFAGKTVNLTQNVSYDLSEYSFTAIGLPTVTANASTNSPLVSGNGFAGTFDGKGSTINVAISSSVSGTGLFGYLKPSGVLKDFTLTGTVAVSGSKDAVGGVVGYNSGTIDNVTNNAAVNAQNCYNVGGIAGFNNGYYGSSPKGDILNCINAGAVSGYSKTGGITGENSGKINSCSNNAAITSTYAGKSGLGGIAGRNGNNNAAVETGRIWNCYNRAVVSCANGKWVGGITGFQNSNSECLNCYTTANIVAYGYKDPTAGKNEGTVVNCYYKSGITEIQGFDGSISKLEGDMKSDEFAALLNAASPVFWNTSVSSTENEGYPTLNKTATAESARPSDVPPPYTVTMTSLPTKLTYNNGESFDPAGMVITGTNTATGSTQIITDYSISPAGALTPQDKYVTVSGNYNGVAYNFKINIKVLEANTVTLGPEGSGAAYETLKLAVENAGNGGTVQVLGTTILEPTDNQDLTINGTVTVVPGQGFTGTMFNVNAGSNIVTLTSMTINAGSSDTIFDVNSGTLRLRGNIKLQNAAEAVKVRAGAKVEMNKTQIDAATAVNLVSATSQMYFNDYGGTRITGKIYLADGSVIMMHTQLSSDITVECEAPSRGTPIALSDNNLDLDNSVTYVHYVDDLYDIYWNGTYLHL